MRRRSLRRTGENCFKPSRKGQTVLDLVTVMIILMVIGISAVVGNKLVNEVNSDVQADPSTSSEAKAFLGNVSSEYPVYMDNAFIIVLVLFWIILIVSSLFIDTHPIFFIVTVFLLLFVFVAGMIISNSYENIVQDGDFLTFSSEFPKTNWVMSNLLIVLMVMGFTAGLALYAKSQYGGGF